MKGFIPSSWFGKQDSETGIESPQVKLTKQTILVVDDSRTQVFAIRKILEDYGFTVLTAENGKHGILTARHKKPDLILMDIVMPEVNGFQATRYLTRHPETSHIPIIIVSGSNQEADKAWGLKLGACDFLSKPTEAPLLLTKVLRQLQMAQQKTPSTAQEIQQVG